MTDPLGAGGGAIHSVVVRPPHAAICQSPVHRRSSRHAAILALALGLIVSAPRLGAQATAAEYAGRRAALVSWLPSDGVIVALGADEPEEDYLSFWQRPDFLYLTGLREPSAAMLLVRQRGRTTTTLFVLPRDPAREVWTGARLGAAGAAERTGEQARTRDALEPTLDSLLSAGLPLFVAGPLHETWSTADAPTTAEARLVARLRARHSGMQVSSVAGAVRRLRGQKSAAELELLRKAVALTVDAQRAAIAAVRPGMNEYELQALVEYTFRRGGADRPSFATIIGSGPNATTLHYNADDRVMRDGDMVVMDIGASYAGYAADVTRSVPVNGRFTAEQRAVYQLVRDAQAAAERQATVGSTKQELADSAAAVLSRGLARLGLIESADATYDCAPGDGGETERCPQYRMYYMHGLGHGIGLEVHDPDQYDVERIARGSAFTLEPGIYVRADLLDVLPDTPRNRALIARIRPAVERYRNIGVRIEDDYIVTERGVEWISRAPREVEELEAMLARTRPAGVTIR